MNGILLVDKPQGMTSHDVVHRVRKNLNEPRVGHAGTLDPMASGLLVLVLGKATKFVKYLVEHDKVYDAEIVVGIGTDTDDTDGKVVSECPCASLDEASVDAVLARFVGSSLQAPPAYAAIKVDGRKLYEYARREVPMPDVDARPITIFELRRIGPVRPDGTVTRIGITARVSKGTYVRALARDIGIALGYPAAVARLRRIRVDRFDVRDAVSLASVGTATPTLIDPLDALGLPRVRLSDELLFKARNGAFLPFSAFPAITVSAVLDGDGTTVAVYEPDADRGVMRLAVML